MKHWTKAGVIQKDDNFLYFPDIGKNIYYDAAHLENLKIIWRMVKHDRDAVIPVVGDPGSGKSVFTMQMAKALDPSFDETKIYFDGEALIRRLSDPATKPYQAFVYDEAREGLSARNSMSRQNKIITDCLAEIRQKNLFIFVVLPDYWDLDSNVANKRSRFLYHIYEKPNTEATSDEEDPFDRGYVRFFNRKSKYVLYQLGKKFHDMWAANPSMAPFLFRNQYVVDEQKYREMKLAALRTNRKLEEDALSKIVNYRRRALSRLVMKFPGENQTVWAEVFGVEQPVISLDLKQIQEDKEKKGGI